MKAWQWTTLTLGALLLVALACVAWLVGTEPGARTSARLARSLLGEKLAIGAVDGTIAGPLVVTQLRYRDPQAGIDLGVQRIGIDVMLRELLRGRVHLQQADLSGIDLALHEPTQSEQPARSEPFSLEPPVDIAIDALLVNDARIRRDDTLLVELTRVAFSGHWTAADLGVQRLEVTSPQGEVRFNGRIAQQRAYTGEGHGQFRWQVADRTFAGVLDTSAEHSVASLTLRLTAPVAALLNARIEQSDHWPWRFTLEAPRFDPREELLPDSALYSLAAKLQGEGSFVRGTVTGQVLINDEPLVLDPVRFTRTADTVTLDSVLRLGEATGEIRIRGNADLAKEPLTATLDARWQELIVPAVWAGQDLHTQGQFDLRGSSQSYRASGAFALGPAGRTAHIALDLDGSPQRVELRQLDIVQQGGRLAARGHLDLQPQPAWDLTATARAFDPGAFAVAWRGRVGFDLASQGHITDAGPAATLVLEDLQGELRGRPLSGHADLAVTPALVPAGTLTLHCGASELRLRGEPGEQINASVSLNIASLDDWVPNSGGELKAAFIVRGQWPELSIAGDARGRALHAADMRIETLTINADIEDPRNPAGTVRVDLARFTAAGYQFDTLQARASGAPAEHRLQLSASGEPLGLELDLTGARTAAGWSGSLRQLVLDVKDAARLALRQPVNIELGKGAADISRACLADGRIELCAAGTLRPDGSMQASYSLANLPLALANAVAAADLPLRMEGTVQGQGEIRRTPQGELFGNVSLQSPSGRVSRAPGTASEAEAAQAPQTLLSYKELHMSANLSGPDARTSLSLQLEPQGSLRADATVRGLGQPQTPLAGQLVGHIPDLAPLAVFAPQLANVHGRADAQIDLAGTMQAPQISGTVSAVELSADVPALGLHLQNGALQARPAASGEIALTGGIDSGAGRLRFAGQVSPSGWMELSVAGERVLAADIPGARVVVTPDLNFVRTAERMKLTGTVTIPQAAIDLQKLPRDGENAQEASSDVVVIDAQTREQQAEQAPLFAQITVTVGEEVDLAGFGLQARVAGRLEVRESPGEPTLGSGEVRVAGRYKAYGQDLTIQRGQLLYAWTPLDNPRLNIEATREVGEVTAGLRVRGSARSPELTVFSDPPMAQANALSYLVAGRPLDDIGAGDEDADAMQTAARSLGAAAGGLLAKNVGRRLGVDEVAVKEDELIGGAALTVGEYLSPRLFLSYGVGLFEPGDVVTLRYKLTDELAVQTQRGSQSTRAGIEYRIEK